jgi:hypothetical protein
MSRTKDYKTFKSNLSDAKQETRSLSPVPGTRRFSLRFVSIFVPFYVFKIVRGTKETLMWSVSSPDKRCTAFLPSGR